mgnify:FL=1
MEKNHRVIMLPTEKTSYIYKSEQGLHFSLSTVKGIGTLTNQHLFLISDDEIKIGDWYMYCNYEDNTWWLRQCTLAEGNIIRSEMGSCLKSECKKVIASTDPKLQLSGISKQFIKAYVKANGIDEVMVEYITSTSTYFHDMTKGGSIRRGDDVKIIPRLKLTDNNEVIIHLEKEEKVYSRVELPNIILSIIKDLENQEYLPDDAMKSYVTNWVNEKL